MSSIDPDLIKELLKDYKKPEDITGPDGLLKQLTKALLGNRPRFRIDRTSGLREERSFQKHQRPQRPQQKKLSKPTRAIWISRFPATAKANLNLK